MDFSLVASVFSFVMSERVLKPKATALLVLGCLLAYDLTSKTHDISSLRVYRGPALLAFTLMMSAYSLRTWRRNGVACDELIFLPGTLHGHEHGIEGPLIEMPVPAPPPLDANGLAQTSSSLASGSSSPRRQPSQNSASSSATDPIAREADMAAGGFAVSSNKNSTKNNASSANSATAAAAAMSSQSNSFRHRRTHSEEEQTVLKATESTGSTVEDPPPSPAIGVEEENKGDNNDGSQESWDMNENETNEDVVQTQTLLHRSNNSGEFNTGLDNNMDGGNNNMEGNNSNNSGPFQQWREYHPQLARLVTLFFFRSSSTTTQSAAYAPSGPAVFGAALDLSMPVLFNFHLFIEAFNHVQKDPDSSDATAKILPLIFLSVLIVRTVIPPGRRFRFWGTLKFTFTAPLHQVRFRDEFIGDALTSWVRPGQDLFFALSYYVTVIWGTISGKHNLTESGILLEESWLLHNVIMPSFAILPLWLKYLQTLRQAYDTNRRWPYQGNSVKYLATTLVVIYAITHPENRTSPWWIACFIATLCYQIFWDVFVDWELFEIQRDDIQLVGAEPDSIFARISSFRPSSHILLTLQMYVAQPILDQIQRCRASIPSWRQIQLRQKRLYKTENFYWKIFAYNTVTRVAWMLCLIPAYHVSRNRTVLTSTSDVNSYWGVILPVAEIIRRTLWGFIFVERETIKLMEADAKYSQVGSTSEDDDDDEDGDADSKLGDRSFRNQLLPTWLDNQQQVAHNAATSRAKERDVFRRQLFVFELYAWAAAFIILGCWAAS